MEKCRVIHFIARKGQGVDGLWLSAFGPVGSADLEQVREKFEKLLAPESRQNYEIIPVRLELDRG